MKKIITSLLVFVLLFNFIFCNNYVYADSDEEETTSPYMENAPVGNVTEMIDTGTVPQKQGAATRTTLTLGSLGTSAIGMITGIIARIINIFIIQIDVIMGSITATEEGTETQFWYTIDRTVFNRVALFNINYFDYEGTYKVGDLTVTANQSNLKIKEGIVKVYYVCRILSLSLALLVLIYIGIRMALSTVASEQAKYKKMLTSWIESVVIMFVLVYIMVAIITLGESLTGIFYDIRCQLIEKEEGYGVFEDTVRAETWPGLFEKSGLDLTRWSIIYWCLLFLEIKFFWLYAKRLLMIGLLITVSPLITITYSIDKAGDGRAQVFSTWMKEFTVNVLIQPLHALVYLIFVLTANTIATRSPIVALALLLAMGSVERMVKVVFDLSGLTTLRGINKFLKKG